MKYIPRITAILKKYGVIEAAIFGSVARGEAKLGSDLDLMIQMGPMLNLFEYVQMKQELEDVVGKKVDLVNKSKIKPRLKSFIMQDLRYLPV
jgi:predicted nucleotidyltransferase